MSYDREMHVFYLQAYVPALIAETIIKKKALTPEDVIIWHARNNGRPWLPLLGSVRDLDSNPFRVRRFSKSRNLAKTWAMLKLHDLQISHATKGRPFQFYIPHSYYQFFQLTSTHSLCSKFHYLEEGLAAYRRADDLSATIQDIGKPLWDLTSGQHLILGRRVQTKEFFNAGASSAWGLTEGSFSAIQGNRVQVEVNWRTADLGERYDDCALVLLGPFEGHSPSNSSYTCYSAALRELMGIMIKSPFRSIYIRKHPETVEEDFTFLYRNVFATLGPRVTVDPTEHPPEVICASARVTLISSGSSAALYAPRFGRPVLSFGGIVAKHCPDFNRRWKRIKDTIGLPFEENDIRQAPWG